MWRGLRLIALTTQFFDLKHSLKMLAHLLHRRRGPKGLLRYVLFLSPRGRMVQEPV